MSCRVITCNLCESPAVTWFGDHLILLIEHALQEPIYNASGEALEDASTAGSKFWEGVNSNSVESEAPDFDAMTLPVLFPFGFGHVPGQCIDIMYVEHRICSGGCYRRFQQTPNYLYTHYSFSFEMKRTVETGIRVLEERIPQYMS